MGGAFSKAKAASIPLAAAQKEAVGHHSDIARLFSSCISTSKSNSSNAAAYISGVQTRHDINKRFIKHPQEDEVAVGNFAFLMQTGEETPPVIKAVKKYVESVK